MVAGSVASTYHSGPRMTRNLDVVVDLDEQSAKKLEKIIRANKLYIDDPVTAALGKDMCNILDVQSGWKADLIVLKERAFSQEEFSRKHPAEIAGVKTFVATVEDVILSKLEWSKSSVSETQTNDVMSILAARYDELDISYIKKWSKKLGIKEKFAEICKTVEEPD